MQAAEQYSLLPRLVRWNVVEQITHVAHGMTLTGLSVRASAALIDRRFHPHSREQQIPFPPLPVLWKDLLQTEQTNTFLGWVRPFFTCSLDRHIREQVDATTLRLMNMAPHALHVWGKMALDVRR